jgi:hypothetical protein
MYLLYTPRTLIIHDSTYYLWYRHVNFYNVERCIVEYITY